MYTLNIFKKNKIPYSWATIYVGRKLQFLKPKEVEIGDLIATELAKEILIESKVIKK